MGWTNGNVIMTVSTSPAAEAEGLGTAAERGATEPPGGQRRNQAHLAGEMGWAERPKPGDPVGEQIRVARKQQCAAGPADARRQCAIWPPGGA